MTLEIGTKIARFIMYTSLAIYYIIESFLQTMAPSFFLHLKDISGKTVLLTGGAGGVGKEIVLRLGRHNSVVIVWDNNSKALENLKEDMKEQGINVQTYVVDISDRDVVYKYARMIKEEYGHIDIIINNAGIVCGQTFLDIPDYMIEKTFKVNVISHYWITKAFLPDMLKRKSGHIVTVGSLTGLLGTYKCVDYSASKYAAIGFHESLMTELKAHGHHYIKMTMICPYFINTGMFDGCSPIPPMLEPSLVADKIIIAIKREETFITLPEYAKYFVPVKYYFPPKLMWMLLFKIMKFPQTMSTMRTFKEVEAA